MEKTTGTLTNILRHTSPANVEKYLEQHAGDLLPEETPFSCYMRALLREKGILQQELFLRADIPEGYGYKLISEEKRTRQRDTILRLCAAGRFSLQETQRALKIYGMSPLYARFPRDAILLSAITSCVFEIPELNTLLTAQGQPPLRAIDSHS